MKLIGIGGEPATGKTTLLKSLIFSHLKGNPALETFRTCRAMYWKEKHVIILGEYSLHDPFCGTDSLSMAVQPDALEYIKQLLQGEVGNPLTVIYEGDRLFNEKFMRAMREIIPRSIFYLLIVHPQTLQHRHELRHDSQTVTWLKGRRTKYDNIALSGLINQRLLHEVTTHTDLICKQLLRDIEEENNLYGVSTQ